MLENFGAAADFDQALVRAREHARLHPHFGKSKEGRGGGGKVQHLGVLVCVLQQLAYGFNFFGDLGQRVDVLEQEGGIAAYGEHGAHLRKHLRLQQLGRAGGGNA